MASESTHQEAGSAARMGRLAPFAVIGLFLLMAGALWARYGVAVFSEMVAAAWALCF